MEKSSHNRREVLGFSDWKAMALQAALMDPGWLWDRIQLGW